MPHSCELQPLEDHFAGVNPSLREAFEALVSTVRENGEVTINATKSRITLQARMRFAGVERPRKEHLVAHFVLTRPVESARLFRVDFVAPYYYVHRLRLRHADDIDAELRGWLAEAYEVGRQRHVSDPGWSKVREPPTWVTVPRASA
jgi:hypothetical protein